MPENVSEIDDEQPFVIESENDEYIPVTSLSENDNDDIQDPPGTFSLL